MRCATVRGSKPVNAPFESVFKAARRRPRVVQQTASKPRRRFFVGAYCSIAEQISASCSLATLISSSPVHLLAGHANAPRSVVQSLCILGILAVVQQRAQYYHRQA
jgi:hypothetical protein